MNMDIKFKPGDEVYFLRPTNDMFPIIEKGKILTVHIRNGNTYDIEAYFHSNFYCENYVAECFVFKTKEELHEYLVKNILKFVREYGW